MPKPKTLDDRAWAEALRMFPDQKNQADAVFCDWYRIGYLRGAKSERRRMSRKRVMSVLDRVLEDGGYKITVRAYNSILTGLGYRLGKYTKE